MIAALKSFPDSSNIRFILLLASVARFFFQIVIFLVLGMMYGMMYPKHLVYYVRRLCFLFKAFILVGRHSCLGLACES